MINKIANIWINKEKPVDKSTLKFLNEDEERLYDLVCYSYEITHEVKLYKNNNQFDAAMVQTAILARVEKEIEKLLKKMRGIE